MHTLDGERNKKADATWCNNTMRHVAVAVAVASSYYPTITATYLSNNVFPSFVFGI